MSSSERPRPGGNGGGSGETAAAGSSLDGDSCSSSSSAGGGGRSPAAVLSREAFAAAALGGSVVAGDGDGGGVEGGGEGVEVEITPSSSPFVVAFAAAAASAPSPSPSAARPPPPPPPEPPTLADDRRKTTTPVPSALPRLPPRHPHRRSRSFDPYEQQRLTSMLRRGDGPLTASPSPPPPSPLGPGTTSAASPLPRPPPPQPPSPSSSAGGMGSPPLLTDRPEAAPPQSAIVAAPKAARATPLEVDDRRRSADDSDDNRRRWEGENGGERRPLLSRNAPPVANAYGGGGGGAGIGSGRRPPRAAARPPPPPSRQRQRQHVQQVAPSPWRSRVDSFDDEDDSVASGASASSNRLLAPWAFQNLSRSLLPSRTEIILEEAGSFEISSSSEEEDEEDAYAEEQHEEEEEEGEAMGALTSDEEEEEPEPREPEPVVSPPPKRIYRPRRPSATGWSGAFQPPPAAAAAPPVARPPPQVAPRKRSPKKKAEAKEAILSPRGAKGKGIPQTIRTPSPKKKPAGPLRRKEKDVSSGSLSPKKGSAEPRSARKKSSSSSLRVSGTSKDAKQRSHKHHHHHPHKRRVKRSYRRRLFLILTEPETSIFSAIFFLVLILMIALSNVIMMMQTMERYTFTPDDCVSCGGETSYKFEDDTSYHLTDPNVDCVCPPAPKPGIVFAEDFIIYFFTVEWILRAICFEPPPSDVVAGKSSSCVGGGGRRRCGYFWQYLTDTTTILDALAIFPYYLERFEKTNGLLSLRLLRLFRVFQLLRLGQYNVTFLSLTNVLVQSVMSFNLLVIVLLFGASFFGSMIYWLEKGEWKYTTSTDPPGYHYVRIGVDGVTEEPSPFTSIPASFWWFIVTATTVGYGDTYPTSIGGKLVATAAMLTGVLVIAFPVSVFSDLWSKELKRTGALSSDPDEESEGKKKKPEADSPTATTTLELAERTPRSGGGRASFVKSQDVPSTLGFPNPVRKYFGRSESDLGGGPRKEGGGGAVDVVNASGSDGGGGATLSSDDAEAILRHLKTIDESQREIRALLSKLDAPGPEDASGAPEAVRDSSRLDASASFRK